MSDSTLRGLVRCRTPDLADFAEAERLKIRSWVASLVASGCTLFDVAHLALVSPRTLDRWRTGEQLPNIVEMERLRRLAAQVTTKRSAG